MKYDIYFTLQSPVKTIELPNVENPVESENLLTVLQTITENFPQIGFGVEVVGIRVAVYRTNDSYAH